WVSKRLSLHVAIRRLPLRVEATRPVTDSLLCVVSRGGDFIAFRARYPPVGRILARQVLRRLPQRARGPGRRFRTPRRLRCQPESSMIPTRASGRAGDDAYCLDRL